VFSPHVRFEGFTTTDWLRVLSLFRPRLASRESRDPNRPKGGIIAVHDRGRLVKVLHTNAGRLSPRNIEWPCAPEDLARKHSVAYTIVLERHVLDRIMEGFAARTRPNDDLTAQSLTLISLARDELTQGNIAAWPLRLRGVPVPKIGMVRTSFDSVCPVGRSMVLGLFERGELWTSIALKRTDEGISHIIGPEEVRDEIGLLSGDWRRDHRHLARTVEERIGPLAFGCFAEHATFRALEVDPSPGAWARASFVRDIILSPMPAPMAIPLGIDAGLAAFVAVRNIVERLDSGGVVSGKIERLWERAAERPELAKIEELLGFHPLDLLRRLLTREQ
jgi:hypothetical protein